MGSMLGRPTDDPTQVLLGDKLYRTQVSSNGKSFDLLEQAVTVTQLPSKDLETVRAGPPGMLDSPEVEVKWSTELVRLIACIR